MATLLAAYQARASETLLFEELFEDTDWTARGWYDSPQMEIDSSEHAPGSGHSCVWHWKKAGDVSPAGRGARVRLTPVTNVTLSFWMKHSPNWKWTGVGWHPNMAINQFLMTPYFGPGAPHEQRIWIDDLRIHTDSE